MKLLNILSISLLMSATAISLPLEANVSQPVSVYSEIPAKTIIIKHPAATNIDGFFSTTTVLTFEIYKAGSKEDLAKMIAAFKKNTDVESCVEGPLTGDYQAMTLTIKSMKSKQWYAELFKKAGLKTIKINNNAIVEVGKM